MGSRQVYELGKETPKNLAIAFELSLFAAAQKKRPGVLTESAK